MNKKLSSVLIVLMTVFFFSCSNKDEVDIRDQFVSTYQVTESWTESGTTYTQTYSMVVTKSAQDQNVILLSNFAKGGTGSIVKAEVNGNKFTIQQQTIDKYGFSGSGTISGSTLSFSYQQSSSSALWNVSATAAKM